MKALSMPISTPRRLEKFPPPLSKFLRINDVGCRSKARSSRSDPVFYIRRRRNAAGMIETAQEPSSPRVSCIGQVRARESRAAALARPRRHRCFLSRFYSRRRALRRILCKWVLFFGAGDCKNVDLEEDCFSVGRKIEFSREKCENIELSVRENGRNFVDSDDSGRSPPMNALNLTRCRSAHYGASPLGERFWSENGEKSEELHNPVCENEVEDSRIRQEL